VDCAIQRCALHPPADQRRAQGGERAVAGRPAGHVPRPQGDEGRPGPAVHCEEPSAGVQLCPRQEAAGGQGRRPAHHPGADHPGGRKRLLRAGGRGRSLAPKEELFFRSTTAVKRKKLRARRSFCRRSIIREKKIKLTVNN